MGEIEVYLQSFLYSALEEGERPASRPQVLSSGKEIPAFMNQERGSGRSGEQLNLFL
jgi:hypothetical protein